METLAGVRNGFAYNEGPGLALRRAIRPFIDVFAVSECMVLEPPFPFEAALLIESDCGRIVHIDGELKPRQVGPAISEVDDGPQQSRPDPSPAPVVMHDDADLTHMLAPRVRRGRQADVAHQPVIHAGDQQPPAFG